LIAMDVNLSQRWRTAAEQKRQLLQESLLQLQDLYQVAADFGLYHLVLVVADLSASTHEKETVSGAWINALMPPKAKPYSLGELQVPPPAKLHCSFPLLMVRRSWTFFLQGDQPQLQQAGTIAGPEDLQLRVLKLLGELSEVLKPGSPVWDQTVIATVLEYFSCAWLKALGDSTSNRSWVALKVLGQKPFQEPLPSLVKFYRAVLLHSHSWAGDLRKRLTPDSSGLLPSVSDEELQVHLAEVVLALMLQWLSEVKGHRADDQGLTELVKAWPSTQAMLAELRTCLEKIVGEDSKAKAKDLLKDVDSLENSGKALCSRLPSGASRRGLPDVLGAAPRPLLGQGSGPSASSA